jgi:hypothetical protein
MISHNAEAAKIAGIYAMHEKTVCQNHRSITLVFCHCDQQSDGEGA